MKTELTLDELNAKWKALFHSRKEMEVTHLSMMDEVWGKEDKILEATKQLEQADSDEESAKELEKFHKKRKKDLP